MTRIIEPSPPPANLDLVTIATFWDTAEANIARNFLHRAGIDTILSDELTCTALGLSPAIGGVKLQVPANQAAVAGRLLSEHTTWRPPAEGEPDTPRRWKP